MVLDFNDKHLKFEYHLHKEYDNLTIRRNIQKYEAFCNREIFDAGFDKVFTSMVFVSALVDKESSYVENLYAIYNYIVNTGVENVPALTKKQFIEQMKMRGYTVIYRYSSNKNGGQGKTLRFFVKKATDYIE